MKFQIIVVREAVLNRFYGVAFFLLSLPFAAAASEQTHDCKTETYCSAASLRPRIEAIVNDPQALSSLEAVELLVNWYRLSGETDLLQVAYDRLLSDEADLWIGVYLQRIYLAAILADEAEVSRRQDELRALLENANYLQMESTLFLAALEGPDGLPKAGDCALVVNGYVGYCEEYYFQSYFEFVSPYRIDASFTPKWRDFEAFIAGAPDDDRSRVAQVFRREAAQNLQYYRDEEKLYDFLKRVDFDVDIVEIRDIEVARNLDRKLTYPVSPEIVDLSDLAESARWRPSYEAHNLFYYYAHDRLSLKELTDWFAAVEDIELVSRDILEEIIYRNIYAHDEVTAQALRDKWREAMGAHDPIDKLLSNGVDDYLYPVSEEAYEGYLRANPDGGPCAFYIRHSRRIDSWLRTPGFGGAAGHANKAVAAVLGRRGREIAEDCAARGEGGPGLTRLQVEATLEQEITDALITDLLAEIEAWNDHAQKVQYLALVARRLFSKGQADHAARVFREIDLSALTPDADMHLHSDDMIFGSYYGWNDEKHPGKEYVIPGSLVEAAAYCLLDPGCAPAGYPADVMTMLSRGLVLSQNLPTPAKAGLPGDQMIGTLEKNWDRIGLSESARARRLFAWIMRWYDPYQDIDAYTKIIARFFDLPPEEAKDLKRYVTEVPPLVFRIAEIERETSRARHEPLWRALGAGYRKWAESGQFVADGNGAELPDTLDRFRSAILANGDSAAFAASGMLEAAGDRYELLRAIAHNPALLTPREIIELEGASAETDDPELNARVRAGSVETGNAMIDSAFRTVLADLFEQRITINAKDALSAYVMNGQIELARQLFALMPEEQVAQLAQNILGRELLKDIVLTPGDDSYLRRALSADPMGHFLNDLLILAAAPG